MVGVAYLGPRGTFSQAAVIQMSNAGMFAAERADLVPVNSITAAIDAVRQRDATYACVPIENSIEGSVGLTLDGLASGSRLQIFGEVTLDVAFSVVVRPDFPAAEIKTVAAFPVAAAQVRRWLAEHLPDAVVVPAISNSGAAQDVLEGKADAGISTALAAELYELPTLAADIADESNSRTRFVKIGIPEPPPRRTGADRTSVVLRLDNAPGALVSALTEFSVRGIDLTRIESRPTRTGLGTYLFFVDCVGHIEEMAVSEALTALRRRCADVKYLGSWPIEAGADAEPPELDSADRWLEQLKEGRS